MTKKAAYSLDNRNARTRDQHAKEVLRKSLETFGAGRSITVDAENVVISGNGVYEQAIALGIPVREIETDGTELIVVKRTDLETRAPRRIGLALADNQTATLAAWDEPVLEELKAELLGEIEFEAMGFEEPTEPEPEGTAEALVDQAAALLEKWGVERGQVWEIPGKAGVHRVMCGDSREALRGIAAASVAMVFTDPPYGHNNNDGDLISSWEAALGKGKSGPARPIANDGPEANDLFRAVLPEIKRVLVPGGCCCCCCGGGGPDPQFARWSLWLDEVIPFKMCVVWDKGGLGMGWHYRRCWECILVAEKPGAACKWYGGNDVPNVIRDISKIIPSKDQHPTEKPIALAEWFILLHSQAGELVLDPFLGSGSTLMAAEQQRRVCVGIDVEPKYVAVTLERCQKAGMEPVRADA